ncbi:spore coat protein [Rossellomorea vietnamensis]|uniref:Spore coat protein n=1 Tax=Rossellomorea vietnamensis TaxID=218284 RepID=A0A5D4KDJ8_9BACI|nr:TasA family protein [Rossellomorea vietnamensis]TYR75252.1 spore coat protein [Rossellomorea vietnamensis]
MGIKKKLGLGVASAALGLSLVGGGTWAAFNDIETMTNSLSAGTLDLVLDSAATGKIDVSKLVPGETIERSFEIQNDGNIDIAQVLLSTNATFARGTNGADGALPGNESKEDYLKQFKIDVYDSDSTNLLDEINPSEGRSYVTLYDFVNATEDDDDFDIASGDGLDNIKSVPGKPAADFDNYDTDTITMELEFVNDGTKTNGEYNQNKFMGNSVTLDFTFEATQKTGGPRSNDVE